MPAASPNRLGLERSQRLKQGRDFARTRQEGQRAVQGCLIANWRRLPADAKTRLGVVTSKADHLANRSLAHVGLAGHFAVVVGADRTQRHKPDPDPLWFALDEIGAPATEAVYVGDSPFDVLAANAAGVRSIGVTWGAASRAVLAEASPAHLVESVGELAALLAKLRPPTAP